MKDAAIAPVVNAVWAVVAEANRYFAARRRGHWRRPDPARQKTVLYVTAEIIRKVAILAQPVMPTSGAKLLDSLGIAEMRAISRAVGHAYRAQAPPLPAPAPVFPRYVEPTAS